MWRVTRRGYRKKAKFKMPAEKSTAIEVTSSALTWTGRCRPGRTSRRSQ